MIFGYFYTVSCILIIILKLYIKIKISIPLRTCDLFKFNKKFLKKPLSTTTCIH